MKKKQKVDLYVALALMLYAILVLLLPIFNLTNIKIIVITTFSFYAAINLGRFIILRDTRDFEGLHYTLTSIVMLIVFLAIKTPSPRNLALVLFGWIALNSLAKLKKADYYNDRRDRMYKFGLLDMCIFLIAGIVTCVNLAYPAEIQVLMLGFYLFINGILEVFDPIIKSLIAHG